ncbi:MAG: hypothetical protein ACYDBX_00395 [Patescibacteria group bacterium]
MELRQYYYDKYKDFYLFEDFIKNNGLENDLFLFLNSSVSDFDATYDDKELPLYDYFYSALEIYYKNGKKGVYDLKYLENILDPNFVAFLISEDGEDFVLYEELQSQEDVVSVLDDANSSEDFIEDLSYKPKILDMEYFYFCDKFEYKYIKEVKILSYIRLFLEFGGNGSCFLDLEKVDSEEGSLILKMYNLIKSGLLRQSDFREYIVNSDHQEDVLDFISHNNG